MQNNNNQRRVDPETSLSNFVDQLIAEKGLGKAKEDQKAKLHEVLMTKLVDHINQSILYQLPEEALQNINNLLDSGNPSAEQIQEIAVRYNLNIKQITGKALLQFRDIFLGLNLNGKAQA